MAALVLCSRCGLVGSSWAGVLGFWRLFFFAVIASKPGPPAVAAHSPQQHSNPVAKYLELVGFRIIEKSPGHLEVRFGVVNHSEADIGEVKMNVHVSTTAAKPDDPPLITFPATGCSSWS